MQRLFIVSADQGAVNVVGVRNPNAPVHLFDIDVSKWGSPNSVAVWNGIVAVAVEAPFKQDPGKVVFFNSFGQYQSEVTVGALPDMVTITPDGKYALVANEGEPSGYEDGDVDPEGSVSIIRLNRPWQMHKLKQNAVKTAGFAAFNGATLDDSVRIFGPGATVAQDLEPEYIAVSADSKTAYVTLQENNAVAIVDIRSAKVKGIKGLGFKDHSLTDSALETFAFPSSQLPSIGTTVGGQKIDLGGFSGLFFEGMTPDGKYKFITNTDRGPNGDPTGSLRPFLLPEFAPELVRFILDRDSGEIAVTEQIPLQRAPGMPLTGLPNVEVAGGNGNTPHNDEIGVDLYGNVIPNDPLGGDFEGVVIGEDGTFWMCDEYRPAIYNFDGNGVLIQRYVPMGAGAAAGLADGTFGTEVLPEILGNRRQNRGFEAIAVYDGKVYAFVQSPLRNPVTTSNGALNGRKNVRVVELDPVSMETRMFIYTLDNPNDPAMGSRPDKIGDAASLGNGDFLVVERDDDRVPRDDPSGIEKKIYRINFFGATDITDEEADFLVDTGKTVDEATVEELVAGGINPVYKILHVDLNEVGYNTVEKVEGLAVVDPWTIAVINDNDFQVAAIDIDESTGTFTLSDGYVPEQTVLGIIDVQLNGLDASDRDDGINIRQWPVFGMYQPDGIDTFKVGGKTYLITANEGDAREYDGYAEEERAKDIELDPSVFPLAKVLQKNENLGRLTITTANGDNDGDGDYDQLYAFGARSFSIWDDKGNLVYDSKDAVEQIIANDPAFAPYFNSNNDENDSFESRSDNKGPEPESVVVGTVGLKPYAFVGLERIGGIMVFDLSDPSAPEFVQYINPRDFDPDLEGTAIGDLGPEGLVFIPAWQSPIWRPLLGVANEISGTVTLYRIDAIWGRR
ncbi:MAG: choice-of-anchor I family protein [Opitutaceae bacterium]